MKEIFKTVWEQIVDENIELKTNDQLLFYNGYEWKKIFVDYSIIKNRYVETGVFDDRFRSLTECYLLRHIPIATIIKEGYYPPVYTGTTIEEFIEIITKFFNVDKEFLRKRVKCL